MTKILGIIPARYASIRFPGKPLIDIGGKTMIQRVYEQCKKAAQLHDVIVATDDQRIFDHINDLGGKAMMTSPHHQNGTERCNEVLGKYAGGSYEYVVNIQGDEPFIHENTIDHLCSLLDGQTELATLVKKIEDPTLLDNPNIMKVVFNNRKEALYFSRSCIPFIRSVSREKWPEQHVFYKHICIYAYRVDVLDKITKLPRGVLEKAESLEQLRWMEYGYKIKIGITDLESVSIDTPDDLERVKAIYHV